MYIKLTSNRGEHSTLSSPNTRTTITLPSIMDSTPKNKKRKRKPRPKNFSRQKRWRRDKQRCTGCLSLECISKHFCGKSLLFKISNYQITLILNIKMHITQFKCKNADKTNLNS